MINADDMIIVTEMPKNGQQAVTRNAVLVESKYQNNFDHFQEYKVHEPESSSQMIEGQEKSYPDMLRIED